MKASQVETASAMFCGMRVPRAKVHRSWSEVTCDELRGGGPGGFVGMVCSRKGSISVRAPECKNSRGRKVRRARRLLG